MQTSNKIIAKQTKQAKQTNKQTNIHTYIHTYKKQTQNKRTQKKLQTIQQQTNKIKQSKTNKPNK